MSIQRYGPVVLVGLALVSGAPRLAAAQNVHVSVTVDLSSEVARDIQRAITQSLPEIGLDLRAALDEVTTELVRSGLAREALQQNQNRSSGRAEQTDRQTRTLNLGASGDLDLSTIAGDITVTAGTGPATLEITRRSRASTDAEAKQAMDRVSVDVEEREARVRVRSNYAQSTRRSNTDVSVSYVLTVPAGTSVTAHTWAGDISITGIRGNVSANTAAGSVSLSNVRSITEAHTIAGTVTISDTETDRELPINSIAGNIVLMRVKARHVMASTISGNVQAQDLATDQAVLKTLSGSIDFRGTLSRDGHYELQTQSGALHFDPTGTMGFDLDAHTFSGVVRIDPTFHLQLVGPQRRSLTGTVGNGGATVTLVTFSGNVTIGKN